MKRKTIVMIMLFSMFFLMGCGEKRESCSIAGCKKTPVEEGNEYGLSLCSKHLSEKRSKDAYIVIEEAYKDVSAMESDLRYGWQVAFEYPEKIYYDGISILVPHLYLTENELGMGVAYQTVRIAGVDWDLQTEEDREKYVQNMDLLIQGFVEILHKEIHDVVVFAIRDAYELNGKKQEVIEKLAKAKEMLNAIKDEDGEGYSELKEYYTSASTIFDMTFNGSDMNFQTYTNTVDQLRANITNCKAQLDFLYCE